MALIVVILNKPCNLLRGLLRNALLEPQSNVFIGYLDGKRIKQLCELFEKLEANALLCVESKKGGHSLRVKSFGTSGKRKIVAMDGLQFAAKNKTQQNQ